MQKKNIFVWELISVKKFQKYMLNSFRITRRESFHVSIDNKYTKLPGVYLHGKNFVL